MKDIFSKIGFALIFVAAVTVGLLLGRYLLPMQKDETPKVTTQTILQSVSAQGFLITQTVISSQKTSYKIDQGSDWSNFWWGHEITAEATMQTSVGIDLAQLTESNISTDSVAKTVCFKYGMPVLKDTTLVGDIEVATKSGVLKKLLASDTNNDYNLAFSMLTAEAQKAVVVLPNLTGEAYKNADKTLNFVLSQTGYTITDTCRN